MIELQSTIAAELLIVVLSGRCDWLQGLSGGGALRVGTVYTKVTVGEVI